MRTRKSAAELSQERARQALAAYGHEKPPSDGWCFSSTEIYEAYESAEVGDARLLIKALASSFSYDHALSAWYQFTKQGHWSVDVVREIKTMAAEVLDFAYKSEIGRLRDALRAKYMDDEERKNAESMISNLSKRLKLIKTSRKLDNILNLASSGSHSLGFDGQGWDADPWLLKAENLVVDLKTGEHRAGLPEDRISKACPTPWLGLEAPCPAWDVFLSLVHEEDGELIRYIQRTMGMALIADQHVHELYIHVGASRNGKGTFFETLLEVLGHDLMCPISMTTLMEGWGQSNTNAMIEMLQLKGVRIAIASEASNRQTLNAPLIKRATGGDTISGVFKFSNTVTQFSPTHNLFLQTNEYPRIYPPDDSAIWDRLRVIVYNRRFVDHPTQPNEFKREYGLKEKLLKERSGILAWLVRGCLDYLSVGLNPPDKVMRATDSYQLEADAVRQFMTDCCRIQDENEYETSTDLYNAFRKWWEELYGENAKIMSQKAFSQNMQKKLRYEGKDMHRHPIFRGVKLKPEA